MAHVEGNAATIMRELNIAEADLVINHEGGPCTFCDGTIFDQSAVEQILLVGQTLNVFYEDNGILKVRIFEGKATQ